MAWAVGLGKVEEGTGMFREKELNQEGSMREIDGWSILGKNKG